MRRILFVDDEPMVLRGLRRMLVSMRDRWDMVFVEGGDRALEELEKHPFDVVVTDMRMPQMDGVKLLEQVRARHPQVVRLVLSGHADREMTLQATALTHQFLAKPCDPEELRSAVDRACHLRDLLADESLRALAASLQNLPSLPGLYQEVVDEINSPDGSMESVGEIISRDIAMSAKVLQLANSAFFGLRREVCQPSEAASFLGLETIKSLILTIQVFSQFDSAALAEFSLEALWRHSLRVGAMARTIARLEGAGKALVEQAMVAGMMHETGTLVLASGLPEKFRAARARAASEGIARGVAERELCGASHGVIGAFLMGIWGLPAPVVEALAGYENPSTFPVREFSALTAVHAASALDGEGEEDSGLEVQLDMDHLHALELQDRLPDWREACASAAVVE